MAEKTLLSQNTIAADGTTLGTVVTEMQRWQYATVLLTVASKSLAGGGTVNVYIQYSPDQSTTWDDLVSFTQITNAAVANGTYVTYINTDGASVADRATADGTLAANNVRSVRWCDRIRAKVIGASFGVNDTVKVTLEAFLE